MSPRRVIRDKLLEEQAGRDGSADRTTDVVEVRAWSLQQFLVFNRKWQLPEFLPVILSGFNHALNELLVVAHDSGDAQTQSPHARAGERRDVDDVRRSLFAGEMKAVGENQPTFGIRV